MDDGWDDDVSPTSTTAPVMARAQRSEAPVPSVASYRPSFGAPAPASLAALVAEVAKKSGGVTPVPIALTTRKAPSEEQPIALTTRKPPSHRPVAGHAVMQAPRVASFAPPAGDPGTLRPRELEVEVELPLVGTRRRTLARLVASVGIAAVTVLASVAWLKGGSHAASNPLLATFLAPAPAVTATPAPGSDAAHERVVAPTDSAPAATAGAEMVTMGPSPPTNEVAAPAPAPTASPPPGDLAASPVNSSTKRVTVKTVPSAAVIFEAGKRLGAGVVELDVERKKKHRLTALMNGHHPVNFTVDGSRDTVTVLLKRAQRVAPPGSESANATGATTADAPTAPARETSKPAGPVTAP